MQADNFLILILIPQCNKDITPVDILALDSGTCFLLSIGNAEGHKKSPNVFHTSDLEIKITLWYRA